MRQLRRRGPLPGVPDYPGPKSNSLYAAALSESLCAEGLTGAMCREAQFAENDSIICFHFTFNL